MQNGFGHTLGLAMVTNRAAAPPDVSQQPPRPATSRLSPRLGGDSRPVREVVRQAGAIGPLGEVQVLTLVRATWNSRLPSRRIRIAFMLVMLLCLASMH